MNYQNGNSRGGWQNHMARSNYNTREDNNSRNNAGNYPSSYNSGAGSYSSNDRRTNTPRYTAPISTRGRGNLQQSATHHTINHTINHTPINPAPYGVQYQQPMYVPHPTVPVHPQYQQVLVVPDNNTYFYNQTPSPEINSCPPPIMAEPNRLPGPMIPVDEATYQRQGLTTYSPTNIDYRLICPQCGVVNTYVMQYINQLEAEVHQFRKQLGVVEISEIGGDPSRSSSSLSVDATPFVANVGDPPVDITSYNTQMVLSNHGQQIEPHSQAFNPPVHIRRPLEIQQPPADKPAENYTQQNYNQSSYIEQKKPDEMQPRIEFPPALVDATSDEVNPGESREQQQADVLQKTIELGLPTNLNQSIASNDDVPLQSEWDNPEGAQEIPENWKPQLPEAEQVAEPVAPVLVTTPVVSAGLSTAWSDETVDIAEEANRPQQHNYSPHQRNQSSSYGARNNTAFFDNNQPRNNNGPQDPRHNNPGQLNQQQEHNNQSTQYHNHSRRTNSDRSDNREGRNWDYKQYPQQSQSNRHQPSQPDTTTMDRDKSNWRESGPSGNGFRGGPRGATRGNFRGNNRRGGGGFGQPPGFNHQFDGQSGNQRTSQQYNNQNQYRQQRHFGNGDGRDNQDQSLKQEGHVVEDITPVAVEQELQATESVLDTLVPPEVKEETSSVSVAQEQASTDGKQNMNHGIRKKERNNPGGSREQVWEQEAQKMGDERSDGGTQKKEGSEENRVEDVKDQGQKMDGGFRRPARNQGQQKRFDSSGGGSTSYQSKDRKCTFITEKSGDLFTAPADHSLAHCVAEDLRMGAGIAITFRTKFGQVGDLLDQKKRMGDVAIIELKERFIYYLITKEYSWGKPTMDSLKDSLKQMKQHCVDHKVKNLAMPKIGCGLDRLEWGRVRFALEDIFNGSGVHITVYSLPENDNQSEAPTPSKKSLFIVKNERMNLPEIQTGTGLLYFCSEEGGATDTMKKIDEKYRFLMVHNAAKKTLGDIVLGNHRQEFIYGLVVKKRDKDPVSYKHLVTSIRKLRKEIEKDNLGYFGMEAFRNNGDKMTMEKVITCLRLSFGGSKFYLEAWCCWPKEFENDHNWDLERPPGGTDTSVRP